MFVEGFNHFGVDFIDNALLIVSDRYKYFVRLVPIFDYYIRQAVMKFDYELGDSPVDFEFVPYKMKHFINDNHCSCSLSFVLRLKSVTLAKANEVDFGFNKVEKTLKNVLVYGLLTFDMNIDNPAETLSVMRSYTLLNRGDQSNSSRSFQPIDDFCLECEKLGFIEVDARLD